MFIRLGSASHNDLWTSAENSSPFTFLPWPQTGPESPVTCNLMGLHRPWKLVFSLKEIDSCFIEVSEINCTILEATAVAVIGSVGSRSGHWHAIWRGVFFDGIFHSPSQGQIQLSKCQRRGNYEVIYLWQYEPGLKVFERKRTLRIKGGWLPGRVSVLSERHSTSMCP